MPLATDNLAEIVLELAARPGHETVRSDVRQLLIDGLGVPRTDVQLEAHIPEVRGWIDALLGRTVVEFKSDLRRERDDAEAPADPLHHPAGERERRALRRNRHGRRGVHLLRAAPGRAA